MEEDKRKTRQGDSTELKIAQHCWENQKAKIAAKEENLFKRKFKEKVFIQRNQNVFFQHSGTLKDIWKPILSGGVKTLRNVDVIIPSAVKKSDTVTLQCKYDLENDPLYTVKWYKGREEFYRYIPKELPSTQIFPLPGIDVDLSKSTNHEVVLRHVQPEVTGRFKCEVSTDAPDFDTQHDSSFMYVVEIPDEHPFLTLEKDTLEYGYFIRANCTAPSTYPPINITWFLNGVKINASQEGINHDRSKISRGKRDPISVTSYVEIEIDDTIFQPVATSGVARLQCVATLFNLYNREAVGKIEDDRPKPRPSSVLGTQGQSSGSSRHAISLTAFGWLICWQSFIIS